jgi:peptide chain release factor subunit 1
LSLRNDIQRLRDAEENDHWQPGGVAVFACDGAGLFEEIRLPHVLRNRIAVDETAWVRPLLAVLDEYHRTCIALVDRSSARLFELYLEELHELAEIEGEAPRKRDYSGALGLEEHGAHRRAEELEKRHFRQVVERLERLFAAEDYDLLVPAGHAEQLPRFEEHLPPDLREKVPGRFTFDPSRDTLLDLRREGDAVVARYERDLERQMVERVLESAAAGGLGAVGLRDCLWAGSLAAVELLLVDGSATAEGVLCDSGHWLGIDGGACPSCGAELRRVPDVIDELVEKVVEDSGTVEHVLADTPLGTHQLAASLRFPLPPVS